MSRSLEKSTRISTVLQMAAPKALMNVSILRYGLHGTESYRILKLSRVPAASLTLGYVLNCHTMNDGANVRNASVTAFEPTPYVSRSPQES